MRAGLIGMGRLGGGLVAAALAAAQGLASPVSIGFVMDASPSMRTHEPAARAALRGLAQTLRPGDEAMLVNFGRETYFDQDLTSDIAKLETAAYAIDSSSGSAIWDSLGLSLARLEKSKKRAKKVLVVVTDGEDISSHESFDQLLQQARKSGVQVYAIGLTGGETRRDAQAARRALRALADASGGKDFYPNNLDQVEDANAQIARAIRGDSAR